ncbi:MAG: phosphatidylglycerophosphatase A [Candidatus Omnitrophica bacterium]|nr:phosphatidylglycerophosphatase A [Candidatus Omnitrophota bacterium]MBU4346434.1 phosphatidylglycerophosphatase A [Candidatus Omnitrophota bacterium]MBU4473616.1 phosphatidylglycerophosphatase A [Candidatus Omnitrophota bacterium]MCG2706333.1 phosphatidylglycerophosphatase A [Candidatus Omnitrophota bacterium]
MNIRNPIIKTLSTFFYVGYLPLIPGTAASIVGVLLFYLVKGSIFIYILSTLALMVIGFLVAGQAERIFNKKDAKCIVIDEVSGMFLSLIFIPYGIKVVILAFCLFRILDALKPYPANKIQGIRGSMGIMGDDIIAGLYTNIILQFVLRYASFMTS